MLKKMGRMDEVNRKLEIDSKPITNLLFVVFSQLGRKLDQSDKIMAFETIKTSAI